jgi:hypothetical protein
MKRALVMVAVCSSFAIAAPQVKIVPPAGWTEGGVPDELLAKLKQGNDSLRADGRMWRSDAASLVLLEFDGRVEPSDAKDVVEAMERSVEQGMQRYKQVSKTRTTVGNRLVIDAKYEAAGKYAHMRQVYAVDDQHIIHSVAASCASLDATSPECEAALDTIDLPVQGVPLEQRPATSTKNAGAYRIGKIVGVVVIAALFVVLVIPRKRKKQR